MPLVTDGSGEVLIVAVQKCSGPEILMLVVSVMLTLFQLAREKPSNEPFSEASSTTNCDRLPDRGNYSRIDPSSDAERDNADLTPELKRFIDRIIVPILIKKSLLSDGEN